MHRFHVRIRRGTAAFTLVAMLAFASGLQAQAPGVDEGALEALSAYADRDYAQSLALYGGLADRNPKDPTYPFMAAKCHNRLGQPAEALAQIERAVANGAQFNAVDYERGRAFFLLGKDDQAVAAYEAFHGKSAGDAVSNQFFAEALEAVGRHQEALDRLKKVKPPKELAFRQEVLTAVGEAGVNRPQEALARLDRLAGQPLDLETRKFLFSLRSQIENKAAGVDVQSAAEAGEEQPERRPWNLSLTLGGEYDTNIPTAGEEPRVRRKGLEDLHGPRAYASLDASYRYEVSDKFAVTGFLETYGNRNGNDLSEFDVHSVRAGLTPEYRLYQRSIFVALEGSYGHTWLNSAGFDNEILIKPYATVVYSQYVATRVSLGWRYLEYDQPAVSDREDNDGRELRFEIAQEVAVKGTDLVLRFGAYHEHDTREGDELSNERAGYFFGFRYELPYKVFLTGRIDRSVAKYDLQNLRLQARPDSDDGERVDKDLIFGVQLSREITDGLFLTLYHTTYDEESNVNEFDYDRSIWGGSLTYRF